MSKFSLYGNGTTKVKTSRLDVTTIIRSLGCDIQVLGYHRGKQNYDHKEYRNRYKPMLMSELNGINSVAVPVVQ